jgi:hypothetical protein
MRRCIVTTTRPTTNANTDTEDLVVIELSRAEHRALLKFKYVDPMQLAQLNAATPIGAGGEYVQVKMEGYLAEMLVGDLSYVINRAKLTRPILLLNAAAEAIELALS